MIKILFLFKLLPAGIRVATYRFFYCTQMKKLFIIPFFDS